MQLLDIYVGCTSPANANVIYKKHMQIVIILKIISFIELDSNKLYVIKCAVST